MARNWWYALSGSGSIIGHFDSESRAQRWAAVWNDANGSDGAYVAKGENLPDIAHPVTVLQLGWGEE